jgi:hypothetical protein
LCALAARALCAAQRARDGVNYQRRERACRGDSAPLRCGVVA